MDRGEKTDYNPDQHVPIPFCGIGFEDSQMKQRIGTADGKPCAE